MKAASVLIASLSLAIVTAGLFKISHAHLRDQTKADLSPLGAGSLGAPDYSGATSAKDLIKIYLKNEISTALDSELKTFSEIGSNLPKSNSNRNMRFFIKNLDQVLGIVLKSLKVPPTPDQTAKFAAEIRSCSSGSATLISNPEAFSRIDNESYEFGREGVFVYCGESPNLDYSSISTTRAGRFLEKTYTRTIEVCKKGNLGFEKCTTSERRVSIQPQVTPEFKQLAKKVLLHTLAQELINA